MLSFPLVLLTVLAYATSHSRDERAGSPTVNQGDPLPAAPAVVERTPSEEKLDAAREAQRAGDHARARVLVAEAIEGVLAAAAEMTDEGALRHWEELGNFAREAGELEAAKRLWEQLLEVRARTLPDEHTYLQRARSKLALTIKSLGDLAGARALEEQVLAICTRTLPDEHPDLQWVRGNLAGTMYYLGDLAGARTLQEQVLAVFTRTLPDEHPNLQLARGNLAQTLEALGDSVGARVLEDQVLAVYTRTLPDEHPNLQRARMSLAGTMKSLGDLAGARALEEQVLEVYTRTLPEEHPDLQRARSNLAGTVVSLGDLAGARALFEQVLAVYTRTLPDEHHSLQTARGNLAGTIGRLGDLAGARALQEQVLAVFTRTLPGEHPDLQTARANLAVTINSLGDLAGARALEEQVLAIRRRTLPEEHPDLQRVRGNLAVTLKSLGDLAAARALQEQVLAVYTRTLPDEHPDLQLARANLGWTVGAETTRRALSGWEGGEKQMAQARETCSRLLHAAAAGHQAAFAIALASASPREVEEAGAASLNALNQTLSFAAGYGAMGAVRELDFAAFTLSETTRGAAVRSASWQRRAQESKATDLRARVRSATDELARLARSGGARDAFQTALAEREAAQRGLAALARELTGGMDLGHSVTAKAVANALGRDDAVVAYRRFKRHDVNFEPADAEDLPPRKDSTESLCAFVVRPALEGGPPSLTTVHLGPLAAIESAVVAWRHACGALEGRGLGRQSEDTTAAHGLISATTGPGTALRRLLLDPLEAALGNARRIVVILDDVTNLVPLDALPREDGVPVGERVRVEVRSSLTELLDPRGGSERSGIALTLGDARFDAQPQEYREQRTPAESEFEAEPQKAQMAGLLRGSVWDSGFTTLAQTGPEARGVAELWNQLAEPDRESIVLDGAAASRSSLTRLAPRARWLHVATHGWHAPESVKSFDDVAREASDGVSALRSSSQDVVEGMSPMLLCGLALAGANLPEDAVGRAPGLFTAEEMSTLDLSNCELAVLSACDTNVGIRKAGQGVASFQRALQMAGARSVITSLWKVPDEATRALMLDFYRRIWVLKQPKWQALWEAKMALRNAKDERGAPLYTTRDWAAWVLSGEQD